MLHKLLLNRIVLLKEATAVRQHCLYLVHNSVLVSETFFPHVGDTHAPSRPHDIKESVAFILHCQASISHVHMPIVHDFGGGQVSAWVL